MRRYLVFVLLCADLMLSGSAFAGSREGYVVLVTDMDGATKPQSSKLIEDYFHGRLPKDLYLCNEPSSGHFELAYLRKRPRTITPTLMLSAVRGDMASLVKVQRIMGNYRDSDLSNGFDFSLAYRLVGGDLELFAISSVPGVKVASSRLKFESVSRGAMQQGLASAVCDLTSMMPYAFAP